MNQLSHKEISDKILVFINKHYSRGGKKDITINSKLLEERIVDSLGLLDIITFLENKFEIIVNEEDILLEKFSSISSISDYVKKSTDTTL